MSPNCQFPTDRNVAWLEAPTPFLLVPLGSRIRSLVQLRALHYVLMLPGMAPPAALGFKLHTGWAALIAITGAPGKFEVLVRRRVELLPPGGAVPRFVYHKAAELPRSQALELVQQAEAASQEAAHAAVKEALEHLQSLVVSLKAAGIPSNSEPASRDLAVVLRSHPLIHRAEVALFQRAIVSACKASGLAPILVPEREVWQNAATAWSLKAVALSKQVDGIRKSVGSPWGADQKTATAFAPVALRSNG